MTKVREVQGRAVAIKGDDIDTDRIIPARFLKEITFARMGEYPFFDERFTPDGKEKDHPFNQEEYKSASVLVVNSNFGCGSSREHAPQSLVRWGIRAIIGESFAEIFAGNCVMLGTPAVTASKEDVAALQEAIEQDPGLEVSVNLETMEVRAGNLRFEVSLPTSRRNALMEGTWDSTALLLANADKVREVAKSLPYTAWGAGH